METFLEGRKAIFAIEGSASLGHLFLLDLLSRGYDLRELQPQVSKNVRQLFTEDHTDEKNAAALAYAARLVFSLPRVRLSLEQAAEPSVSHACECDWCGTGQDILTVYMLVLPKVTVQPIEASLKK